MMVAILGDQFLTKYVLIGVAVCTTFFVFASSAQTEREGSWRVAGALNVCLINCASDNVSCKRLCPATYNGPCISACDNQAQFCRQNCQQK
jgi:hypothetical protein